jgi:Mn2+/Fe2+ NRAMP family transporter
MSVDTTLRKVSEAMGLFVVLIGIPLLLCHLKDVVGYHKYSPWYFHVAFISAAILWYGVILAWPWLMGWTGKGGGGQ